MRTVREAMLLYAITDRAWLRPGERLEDPVARVLAAGATCLQLREKHLTEEELTALAWRLKPVCARYDVPFIINDSVRVAKAVDADGVHLGQEDGSIRAARAILGPEKWIGTSAHNVREARTAFADGCDYMGCGAVFGSRTKTDTRTLPWEELCAICAATPLPTVAIGGITAENAAKLAGSGVDGIAVVSALFAQEDLGAATRRMLALAREAAKR